MTLHHLLPHSQRLDYQEAVLYCRPHPAPAERSLMPDYEPLDLSPLFNAGLDMVGGDDVPPVGTVLLRGLPFQMGDNLDRCLLALESPDTGVTVPVGKLARRIVVAHRTQDEVPAPGELVATYKFNLAGGERISIPIRAGFEIGSPTGGGTPYSAFIDQAHTLFPRHEGSWNDSGRRAMETATSSARWYLLWVWQNPTPDLAIESIEIVPSGPRFLVAGITLGNLDEDPISRDGKKPAKIVLTNENNAVKKFDLDVEIDRGVAGYVHPLPQATAAEFLDDAFAGWGQQQNTSSSPAYVDIAATPSSTVQVRQDGEALGQVNWGDVQTEGTVETPRITVDQAEHGKNWVHTTVLDADTGEPVPCRIHFRSPEGVPYQPYGHHNQVNSNLATDIFDIGGDVRLGQITYAYIDGKCQGWLPRGEVIVDVARGFEYEPLRTTITIEPGQRELTLRIKRWVHMNRERWYSGDSHVHFLSAQGALTEGQGEDLNVVNLLQSQWGNLFTSTEDFTGRPTVSQVGDNVVYVCQENREHAMGHLILWGLKEPVMPWCTNGPGEAELGGTMEATLSDWADQCHAQGGTVIAPHIGGLSGEIVVLIATGRIEGMEMVRMHEKAHKGYYQTLNSGYQIPLVGGTDKMSADVTVGLSRTYARLPEGQSFNYDNWCRAVASGRTFASSGPIIRLTVDGQDIGDTLQIPGPGTVEVEAIAESIFPIYSLEIVQEGRVVASVHSKEGSKRLMLSENIAVDGHTWIAARCGGPEYYTEGNFNSSQPPSWSQEHSASSNIVGVHFDAWRRGIFAHTSPVYVACGGEWSMFDPEIARNMLTSIEGSLTYIRQVSTQHDPETITHHHGEGDHMAYLERPFQEAKAALEQRLRDWED